MPTKEDNLEWLDIDKSSDRAMQDYRIFNISSTNNIPRCRNMKAKASVDPLKFPVLDVRKIGFRSRKNSGYKLCSPYSLPLRFS